MIKKHAYLIIAHNNFDVLKHLLMALDDKRNDIYIHLDKKVKQQPKLETLNANLFILPYPINVKWGGYSLIQAELMLFEQAYVAQGKIEYSYYHLLSGVDYPLKSQDYIHRFFRENMGKEFIGYYVGDTSRELLKKVQVYVPFESFISNKIGNVIRRIIVRMQTVFGGTRNKDIILKKGTNWVSVTNDFVKYLLTQKEFIYKRFNNTLCGDEIYKHTICWNSDFKNNLYCIDDEAVGCMREINWQHSAGYPYLPSYTIEDYERLNMSSALFARKFDDENIDIVLRLERSLR